MLDKDNKNSLNLGYEMITVSLIIYAMILWTWLNTGWNKFVWINAVIKDV